MKVNNTIIAIDYGTKKSGLAYSVESFAFAYRTVLTKELIPALEVLIAAKSASQIIIGMPYNIDGTISTHGRRVRSYVDILRKHISLPISFYDERLTTTEATLGFTEAGIDGDIDAESARLILEAYLEMNL